MAKNKTADIPAPILELARCNMRAAVDRLFLPHWVFVTKKKRKRGRGIVYITFEKEAP